MSRYFAVPVLATMLALVGVRWAATSSPKPAEPLDIVVSSPVQDPEPPAVRTPAPQPAAEPPAPAPPLPAPAPVVIVIEPPAAPQAPAKTEVVERTVYVPQQPAIVYAPTTIYAPIIEAPAPQDVVETPVMIVTNAVPPVQHPRHAVAKPEKFFKDIPFLPPTPRGPRWNP